MRIRLWVLAFILLVALLIQLAHWHPYAREHKALGAPNTTPRLNAEAEHQVWHKRLIDTTAKRNRLEDQLLFKAPDTLLPGLSKVAETVGIQLVGVEEHDKRHRMNYDFHPISITLSGDYRGISEFLSVVERMAPTARMDELKIKPVKAGFSRPYKNNAADSLQSRLTLTPISFRARGHPLTVPDVKQFTVKRNPFETGIRPGGADLKIRPPTSPPNSATPFPTLTSILFSETQPLAILSFNGISHTMGVGDEIYGVKMTHIHPDQVTVIRGTSPKTLFLWNQTESNHPKSPPIVLGTED